MRYLSLTLALLIGGCATCANNVPETDAPVLGTAPTVSKGGSTQALGAIPLRSEVNLPGYELRARSVTIQPGGYLAAHTHQGRPSMEYVAQAP
jgi:quercetin dioxygenase-like cupin family protein